MYWLKGYSQSYKIKDVKLNENKSYKILRKKMEKNLKKNYKKKIFKKNLNLLKSEEKNSEKTL